MNRFLLFLSACCLTLSLSAQETADERTLKVTKTSTYLSQGLSYKDKYAIFIGINDYKDPKINNLKYAVSDAKALSQLFVSQLGFDSKKVIILLDSAATRTSILDTLQRFIDNEAIPENSQLIVYFGGHGSISRTGNKGYLLNYDAREGSELSTAISMDEISKIASECRPKHVLFLIDACYGGFVNTRSAGGAFVKNIWNQKSRLAITAGTSEEKVIEAGKWQHSAFTKVLIDGLERHEADSDNDNIVNSSELHNYLESRVSYYANQEGGKQTPIKGKLTPDDGAIFIELKEGALKHIEENAQMLNDDEIAEKFYSKVLITANVKTARVFRDGVEIGYLNDGKFEHSVKPGFYRYDLKLEKFETASLETVVHPDTTVSLHLNMESKVSRVSFKVTPEDAAIILNGNLIGTGSFTAEVQKGRHEVLIDKKGYKPEKTLINLVQDETSLAFDIQKISSTIELYSNPSGAVILNNSDTLGTTPKTITLGYGQHTLIFSKKDYLLKDLLIDVKESGLQRQDILLIEKPEVLVAKEARKLRTKAITNFFILGGLTYGAYYGHNLLKGKLESDPPPKQDDADLIKIGKTGTIVLGSIFAITSTVNLVKIFTISKSKLMRKRLEEKTAVSFIPFNKGAAIAVNIKF